jgi:hypothetical protein
MSDEGGDGRDVRRGFSDAFSDSFQKEDVKYYGALSLTFAGIVYTALIAVVGVVAAMIPVHGWTKLALAAGYMVASATLFLWGLTRGRSRVIAWSRATLELPEDRG